MAAKRNLWNVARVMAVVGIALIPGVTARAAGGPGAAPVGHVVGKDCGPDGITANRGERFFTDMDKLVAQAPDSTGGKAEAVPAPAGEASEEVAECTEQRIDAHATLTYDAACEGDGPARVSVTREGGESLDVGVYDDEGRLVASAEDAGDREVLSWGIEGSNHYQIRIRNLGDAIGTFTLCAN